MESMTVEEYGRKFIGLLRYMDFNKDEQVKFNGTLVDFPLSKWLG